MSPRNSAFSTIPDTKKSLVILVLILMVVGCFQDRGKISGKVTDTQGNPMANVTVVIDLSGYTATTNEYGEYVISDVPTGDYTVTATSGSYSNSVDVAVKEESLFSCAEINIKAANIGLSIGNGGNGLDENLIAYYKFDENTGTTASDYSIYGNTGTISGSTWVAGKEGSALSFDGIDDYVEAPHFQSLNLTSEVTLMAWINPTEIRDWNRIVGKSHTSDVEPYNLYGLLFDDQKHIRMEVGINGTETPPYTSRATIVIDTGVWTHAACTYDGTEIKLYVNGNLDTTFPVSGPMDTNTMPLSVGRSGFDKDYFKGIIDEVRVYKIALTEEQINAVK